MLLTLGKFAIVAALAFTVGALVGRQHPPASAKQKQLDAAVDRLGRTLGVATPSKSGDCDVPSTTEVFEVSYATDDGVDNKKWARVHENGTVWIAATAKEAPHPVLLVSYRDDAPDRLYAANTGARLATSLPSAPGTLPKGGQRALNCINP